MVIPEMSESYLYHRLPPLSSIEKKLRRRHLSVRLQDFWKWPSASLVSSFAILDGPSADIAVCHIVEPASRAVDHVYQLIPLDNECHDG